MGICPNMRKKELMSVEGQSKNMSFIYKQTLLPLYRCHFCDEKRNKRMNQFCRTALERVAC
jgi:hypothetical protein